MKHLTLLTALALSTGLTAAHAQSLDLGSTQGGPSLPINITASQGIEWQQDTQTVTVTGNAKAVRGAVTVLADQLIAHYRKKPGAPAATGADALTQSGAQLYELDAIGHVHIFTATDNAYGDHAVYNMDESVLVLTGENLKLTTQHDTLTARAAIAYYSVKRMAVARGDALVVTDDGRSAAADTLVGYLIPANAPTTQTAAAGGLPQAGALQKVDAIGHVVIHTQTDTATGDAGVYLPQEQLARLGGDVHIVHGQNDLEGSDALVNMKTGIATLLAAPGGQVAGTILPNSVNSAPATTSSKPKAANSKAPTP